MARDALHLCAREAHLPDKYIPDLREATKKAGLDWDKFLVTDNSCPPHPPRKNPIQELGDDIIAVRARPQRPLSSQILAKPNVLPPARYRPMFIARIMTSQAVLCLNMSPCG